MYSGRFVSSPIWVNLGSKGLDFDRADVEVYGVDLSGPSFEARLFLNNPNATFKTPPTKENGYAGSFHIYGYGIWPADIGKDQAALEAEWKSKIRAPITKTVIATEAIRAAARKSPDITVTVVPLSLNTPPADAADALKLEGVRIVVH